MLAKLEHQNKEAVETIETFATVDTSDEENTEGTVKLKVSLEAILTGDKEDA